MSDIEKLRLDYASGNISSYKILLTIASSHDEQSTGVFLVDLIELAPMNFLTDINKSLLLSICSHNSFFKSECGLMRLINLLIAHAEQVDQLVAYDLLRVTVLQGNFLPLFQRRHKMLDPVLLHLSDRASSLCESSVVFSVFDVLTAVLVTYCSCYDFVDVYGVFAKYGQIAINCLQSKNLSTSTEHLTSVMNFSVAMSHHNGESLGWLQGLSCGPPVGGDSSSLSENIGTDHHRPFLLLILVAMIELRLRLPTKNENFVPTLQNTDNLVRTCLEILSFGIADLAAGDDDKTVFSDKPHSKSLVASMTDESVSAIFLHFLEFSIVLRDSLANSDELTITTSDCDPSNQLSSTAVKCLAVYLQWSVFYFKNHMASLAMTNDAGTEDACDDETLFQPQPPTSREYDELAARFECDTWRPIAPIANQVVCNSLQISSNCGDEKNLICEFITCRKHICSLVRLFPCIIVETLDASMLMPPVQKNGKSAVMNPMSKQTFSWLDSLCDLALILDAGLVVSAIKKVTTDDALSFKDTCISVLGKVVSVILLRQGDEYSPLDLFLSTENVTANCSELTTSVTSSDCAGSACTAERQSRVLDMTSSAIVFLRFLTANFWQAEIQILIGVAESADSLSARPTGGGDETMRRVIEKLCHLNLRLLQFVSNLPQTLIDNRGFALHRHFSRRQTTAPSLRISANTLLQCCRAVCQRSACFKKAWKAGLSATKLNTRIFHG